MRTVTPENVVSRIESTEPQSHKKPIEHLIAELHQIDTALAAELPRFLAKGVTEPFCRSAAAIASEVERRESHWIESRGGTPEQKKQWKAVFPEVTEEHDDLIDTLEMALFDNPDAMRAIDLIKQGDSPEDMLLDITSIVNLANKFPAESAQAGLTQPRLAEIAQRGKVYADLYAKTLALPGGSIPAKTARDKARTFAEEYLSLVRFFADRVFRNEPEKRAMFTSKYTRDRNRESYLKAKAKKAAAADSLITE